MLIRAAKWYVSLNYTIEYVLIAFLLAALLFEDGRENLVEKFLDTAREIPMSFFHAAIAYLVAFSTFDDANLFRRINKGTFVDPKYYDLVIEKDGVGTLTTLMGEILKLDISAKLISEVIDGYVVMLEHGTNNYHNWK